jgi:hypothetical protein
MVFNATLSNRSVILWRSVLLVAETTASLDKKLNLDSDVPKENGIPRVTSKSSLESQISSRVKPQGVRKGSVCLPDTDQQG